MNSQFVFPWRISIEGESQKSFLHEHAYEFVKAVKILMIEGSVHVIIVLEREPLLLPSFLDNSFPPVETELDLVDISKFPDF